MRPAVGEDNFAMADLYIFLEVKMRKNLLSVGIDLGTTTTQVVFSRIWLEYSSAMIPEVKIAKKEIIYSSKIYFTPFIGQNIDLSGIKSILETEYANAQIDKKQITTGAVIITGETARRKNAEEVLHALAEFAGNFVVATAGPELESVLAGFGAGAAEVSETKGTAVLNFDIGGGTTNAVLFEDGCVKDAFALDIGGRLVRINSQGIITYVSECIKPLINELNINIYIGHKAMWNDLCVLTGKLAEVLFNISKGQTLDPVENELFIGQGVCGSRLHQVMFSGGVAEFIYSEDVIHNIEETAAFGDIGPLLGYMIRRKFMAENEEKVIKARERIRATVIGAGSYSMSISGSTVVTDNDAVPIKNVPVLFVKETDMGLFAKELSAKLKIYPDALPAVAFYGPEAPSYEYIKKLARAIVSGLGTRIEGVLIILVENDFAKALGMTLEQLLPNMKIICLDHIKVHDGDYVDIGKSVGKVVPVVVKTLVF